MNITKENIDKLNALLDHGLVKDLGVPEPGKMCVEAAVCAALGLPHGDDPGCVIDSLRNVKIALNDSDMWDSNQSRAEGLRRLAIAQIGTRGAINEGKFARRVVTLAIRVVVPIALRVLADETDGEHAQALRDIADKCEANPIKENARQAEEVADAYPADATDATHSAYNAVLYATIAADAYTAANVTYAAIYAAGATGTEKVLRDFAEGVVQILIDMKAPGCAWLGAK